MRHARSELRKHLRVGRADHRTDIGPRALHEGLAPGGGEIRDPRIERLAVNQLILQLAARRIRSLDEHKNTLVTASADLKERLYAVAAEVGVHGRHIRVKGEELLLADGDAAEVSLRIRRRGRTDVAALHIGNHDEPELLRKANGLFIGDEAGNSELLVHRNLRLHGRNQICRRLEDGLVKAPAGLGRSLQIFALFGKRGFFYLVRNIRQHGIQTHADRCLGLFDFIQ